MVGELKTEKEEEGLEEGEALWVKGDGSGVVKREGEDGGAEVEEEEEEWGEKGSEKCVDCGEKRASYGFEDGKKRFCAGFWIGLGLRRYRMCITSAGGP